MKKNRIVLALAGAGLLSLALGGCSGGGSDSDSGTTSPVTTVDMKVSPALGKYRNRTGSPVVVTLKDKNGATIKTGTWDDANGNGTFTGIDDSLSSLIIEVSGGEYFDEAAGTYRANNRTQRAVVDKPYGAVAVTPLTHAAAKRLIDDSTGTPKIKTAVSTTHIVTENLKEGKRFGVTNPLIPPVLVGETERIAATDNLEAQRYAAILAGMAQAANNAAKTPDEMAEHLASDLADDKLDGQEGTTPISGLAYATADVTTNFATLINTVIQTNGLTADAGTLASLQTTVTAEVAPPVELTTEQVAEAESTADTITATGDPLGQAKQLFSGLRSGVTPYVNPQGTGYTQTALTALQADFGTLTGATVGLDRHVQALGEGAAWLFKRIGGNATLVTRTTSVNGLPVTYEFMQISNGPFYAPPSVRCRDDAASVAAGLYDNAETSFKATAAISCWIPGEVMWSEDKTTFDRVVYFVYTDSPMLSGAPNNTTVKVKWSGRVDRFQHAGTNMLGPYGTLIIKGVGSTHATVDGVEDPLQEIAPKNRRNGTFSATATASETTADGTTTEKVVASLNDLKGDLWPVVNNTTVNTTDRTTIDLSATLTYQATANATTGEVSAESHLASLSGSMIAYTGSTELARLAVAPADGLTSIVNFDESALSSASGGLRVTFGTPKYEISGQLSASGLTKKTWSDNYSYYSSVFSGGDYNWNPSCTSMDPNLCYVQVAAGTGTYVKITNTWSNDAELPNTLTFSGTVKDLVTSTTIFEGSFTGSADYTDWNPSLAESTTNYIAGSATLIGKLKKSSADAGLSLTAVFTKSGAGGTGNAWQLTYKDANALTVSASFKESDGSGTITNSANSIVVTWYRNDAAKDGDVRAGTTVLGKIVRGIVTYVDGSTESVI